MKIAVIMLSDPKGGDDALGRAFNALAVAQESMHRNDEVETGGSGRPTPAATQS